MECSLLPGAFLCPLHPWFAPDSAILRAMDSAQLRSIPLFASLTAKERDRLAAGMDVIDLPAGRNRTEQGALSGDS